MVRVVAESGAGVVVMHMRGTPRTMQDSPVYEDVLSAVVEYLAGRVDALCSAGIAKESIAIDPGIGFGKTVEDNLALLAGLPRLKQIGCPVLVGLSRKSFIGKITGAPVGDRMPGSIGGMVYAAMRGADIVRVHDVAASVQALDIVGALLEAEG